MGFCVISGCWFVWEHFRDSRPNSSKVHLQISHNVFSKYSCASVACTKRVFGIYYVYSSFPEFVGIYNDLCSTSVLTPVSPAGMFEVWAPKIRVPPIQGTKRIVQIEIVSGLWFDGLGF